MVNIELLKKICLTPGAPGFEHPIRSLLMNELKACTDSLEIDAMGNLIAFKKGTHTSKLMLTAHMDEIAFIVQHIDDDGFIRFLPLGGFDAKTLTAQRVIIHGKKEVTGVMGSKPIHLMNPDERNKAPQIKDYFIDTGLPKQ
jgi:endoglucanase